MKLFVCQNCAQLLYFENDRCENCGKQLGYLPDVQELSVIDPAGDRYTAMAAPDSVYRPCANAVHNACNWMVRDDEEGGYCLACRHNHTVPDLTIGANLTRWRKVQQATHHLFYGLVRLGLIAVASRDEADFRLAFDILADDGDPAHRILTGHEHGLITLNLIEADDAARERMRQEMGEPYRTLLGHFRHESGHFFEEALVERGGHLAGCRAVFGDDTLDYAEALAAHYQNGPPADWGMHFVSAYASSHPQEDFAETWAHYLHIVDTLEMAGSFGLRVRPNLRLNAAVETAPVNKPAGDLSIEDLIEAWLPITFAVNSLNRCMGQQDLYPFVLAPAVIAKLGFMHDLVHGKLPAEAASPASSG